MTYLEEVKARLAKATDGPWQSTDIPALLADRAERTRLLRDIEWVVDSGGRYLHCPCCQNAEVSGHNEHCQLAEAGQ
mgnify:CR=1 FL=1